MQIFSRNGQFLSRIAIKYIDIVAGLAVTEEGNIVAVDSVSATLFVISETGVCLNCFECGVHMQEPSDIVVHNGLFYICDFKGHNIVVFNQQGEFLGKIGDKKLTNYPNGIDIAANGDILCGDSHGNKFHIVVFDKTGKFLSEYECLYAKVSRCCGLKITSEGYIVTLAKNNHHVLVLDTLTNSTSPNHNLSQGAMISDPMNGKQMISALNSPSRLSNVPSNNSTPTMNHSNSNLSKENLDLSDYMTQYNLALLALCDTNNAIANANNHQQQQQQQTPTLLSPQQQKIAAFNQLNNSNNNNNNNNNNDKQQHHSSSLNTSILEQQLHELSFNDSIQSTTGGQLADLNSMLASPTPLDHSNLTIQQTNSKTGKVSMAIRYKFGHLGSNKGQFSSPHGFCLGADEEIVIADTYNHRICVFNKSGEFLYQFGNQGKEEGELFHPRKVSSRVRLT